VGRLFGTDGVRGLANRDITAELAVDLAVAARTYSVTSVLSPDTGPAPWSDEIPGLAGNSLRLPSWPASQALVWMSRSPE